MIGKSKKHTLTVLYVNTKHLLLAERKSTFSVTFLEEEGDFSNTFLHFICEQPHQATAVIVLLVCTRSST